MTTGALALFGTINGFELLVVVAAALMVFGSRLPDVALRAVAHVMRARRAVTKMWRDTGLEDELRKVRRDIEMSVPRAADFDLPAAAPPAAAVDPHDEHDEAVDPDEARAEEYYDSSVDIRPAEGIIASGEWSADDELDRREPSGEEGATEAETFEPSVGEDQLGPEGPRADEQEEPSSVAEVAETEGDLKPREG